MTLMTGEHARPLKRKNKYALARGLALENAVNLSQDEIRNKWTICPLLLHMISEGLKYYHSAKNCGGWKDFLFSIPF